MIFERQFIFHTYACRKGKGTHRAVKYAFEEANRTRYFLKLDVRKYFDNVNHEFENGLVSEEKYAERVKCMFAVSAVL